MCALHKVQFAKSSGRMNAVIASLGVIAIVTIVTIALRSPEKL